MNKNTHNQLPELDLAALAYDDEATIEAKQKKYASDMSKYVKGKMYTELETELDKLYYLNNRLEENIAKLEHSVNPAESPEIETNDSVAWYKRTWFIILLLIVFPPVGIFLMYKYLNDSPLFKILLTIMSCVLFVLLLGTTHKVVSERNDRTVPINYGSSADTSSGGEYVITESGKRYHYNSCRHVKTIKQFVSVEEAQNMGYTACGTCKPPNK